MRRRRRKRQKEKNCGEHDFADNIQQMKERENTRLPEALIYFPSLFNYPYTSVEMYSYFYNFYREFMFEKRGFIFLFLDKKNQILTASS